LFGTIWTVGDSAAAPTTRFAVGTSTFLFTDIEGSTALLGRLGTEKYADVLAEHHRVIRESLAAHAGVEVDTQGDAFFAVFASPSRCAAAAISIQRSLATVAWPDGEDVRVRMGLHHGEAAETANGPVGHDVHRAARIAGVAHGGQILVSETAAALLRDSLPASAALLDLGQQRLKDMGRPEQVFQLVADGLNRQFPPLRSLNNPALANNLPQQASRFIGRRRELDHVRSLVESSRVLTLTGPGGSGKTRLALQVAADLLDGSGDGVWLVELAGVADQAGGGAGDSGDPARLGPAGPTVDGLRRRRTRSAADADRPGQLRAPGRGVRRRRRRPRPTHPGRPAALHQP
jgi:class 3 adenylate cyclase